MATDTDAAQKSTTVCVRCKENEAELDLRSDAVCRPCYATFVASKVIKRLEVLQRETRGPRLPTRPQRYLLALSKGPSSTALLHILSENLQRQRERKGQRVKFELVVVWIDSSCSPSSSSAPGVKTDMETETDPFTRLFPSIPIHRIPLSSILSSPSIAWPSLPTPTPSSSPAEKLNSILAHLPSPSARADVARLLTRHAILAAAEAHACDVVLLGYNTTALAELTLTETAKGRGFGIPWLVNDGVIALPRSVGLGIESESESESESGKVEGEGVAGLRISDVDNATTTTSEEINSGDEGERKTSIPVYSPLREIFRKEILTYLSITPAPSPSLSSSSLPSTAKTPQDNTTTSTPSLSLSETLFPSLSLSSSTSTSKSTAAPAVVSHRDLSLDDVVSRFFVDVEASYPSVVANVVRTTGKLERPRHTDTHSHSQSQSQSQSHNPNQIQDQEQDQDLNNSSCGLCGVHLDPKGDERWKGEIGEVDIDIGTDANTNTNTDIEIGGSGSISNSSGRSPATKGRLVLCYGCERSVRG